MKALPPLHESVLANDAITGLAIRPNGRYVDCTFGAGGHSLLILQHLNEKGKLLALDRDPAAIARAKSIHDERLSSVHTPFSGLEQAMQKAGLPEADGILFDLGISSAQLDDPNRGFSYRHNGPLDMRMDPNSTLTAANLLSSISLPQLSYIIQHYGEDRHTLLLSKAIHERCAHTAFSETHELAAFIRQTLSSHGAPPQTITSSITRVFQSLRIVINNELGELEAGLNVAIRHLTLCGRLLVIAFHSLEDRLVKQTFRALTHPPVPPPHIPIRDQDLPAAKYRIIGKLIRPDYKEIEHNPRSRSARMRILERIAL